MPRIAAIDFGMKRTGLAISDPLAMIANGQETVATTELMQSLKKLYVEKPFDTLVVGHPKKLDGTDALIEQNIALFIESFAKSFPTVAVARVDERFTSKIAARTMAALGAKKTDRERKENLDKMSATLLLQEFLDKEAKPR